MMQYQTWYKANFIYFFLLQTLIVFLGGFYEMDQHKAWHGMEGKG